MRNEDEFSHERLRGLERERAYVELCLAGDGHRALDGLQAPAAQLAIEKHEPGVLVHRAPNARQVVRRQTSSKVGKWRLRKNEREISSGVAG